MPAYRSMRYGAYIVAHMCMYMHIRAPQGCARPFRANCWGPATLSLRAQAQSDFSEFSDRAPGDRFLRLLCFAAARGAAVMAQACSRWSVLRRQQALLRQERSQRSDDSSLPQRSPPCGALASCISSVCISMLFVLPSLSNESITNFITCTSFSCPIR